MRHMNNLFKVSIGIERLLWFTITFLVTVHLIACLWILLAKMEDESSYENWIF